jgi:hypothetical protein
LGQVVCFPGTITRVRGGSRKVQIKNTGQFQIAIILNKGRFNHKKFNHKKFKVNIVGALLEVPGAITRAKRAPKRPSNNEF